MDMIDVSGCDLHDLVRAAYDLSVPQGLGFLHFTPDSLSDAEVDEILAMPSVGTCVLYMDYVKGRACKFGVWDKDGALVIWTPWYDHTDAQLAELLKRIGADAAKMLAEGEHGLACNCVGCQESRQGL